jgi:hypothetical protein
MGYATTLVAVAEVGTALAIACRMAVLAVGAKVGVIKESHLLMELLTLAAVVAVE